ARTPRGDRRGGRRHAYERRPARTRPHARGLGRSRGLRPARPRRPPAVARGGLPGAHRLRPKGPIVILLLIRLVRMLASTRPREASPPARPSGALRGTVALLLHQSRYDLLGILRDRQARFFTLVLPLIFLVIFVGVFGNDTVGPQHVKASTYYVPGLTALAIISGSFVNLVISVTAQRESGVLKRRRATPVPAWVIIGGRTLTAIVVSMVVSVVLLAVGR